MRGHGFGFGGLFGPELAPKGRRSAVRQCYGGGQMRLTAAVP